MIRTCLDKSIRRSDVISIIDLEIFLRTLKWNILNLWICVLCVDVITIENIPRIGNKTAFNLIKKYKTIENVLPAIKNIPEGYEIKYKISRKLFTMYQDNLDMQQLTIHHSPL